jgi:DnaJ domain
MASHDPLGYYKALGVLPDATLAVIKAVYRVRAMELHPDRNKAANATRQFQVLQRAYEVLSDAKAREAYDARAVDPAADQAASANPARYEPIHCSRCGVVSAQPRYRVFHSVIGYVVGAVKRTHSGIVCAKCETIVALKATAVTLVFGWWSIHGFFWSIGSILTNLVGGQEPTFWPTSTPLRIRVPRRSFV